MSRSFVSFLLLSVLSLLSLMHPLAAHQLTTLPAAELDIMDVARLALPGYAVAVQVKDGIAYVGSDSATLRLVDVHNPAAPRLLGGYDAPGQLTSMEVVGSLAYLGLTESPEGGLAIVDVSDHLQPRGLPISPAGGGSIRVRNNLLSFAAGSGFGSTDVADLSNMHVRSSIELRGQFNALDVNGTFAYVTGHDDQYGVARIADVSNPDQPVWRQSLGLPAAYSEGLDIEVEDGFAYVATRYPGSPNQPAPGQGELDIFDVREPTLHI
jgi:hypothetical protein